MQDVEANSGLVMIALPAHQVKLSFDGPLFGAFPLLLVNCGLIFCGIGNPCRCCPQRSSTNELARQMKSLIEAPRLFPSQQEEGNHESEDQEDRHCV